MLRFIILLFKEMPFILFIKSLSLTQTKIIIYLKKNTPKNTREYFLNTYILYSGVFFWSLIIAYTCEKIFEIYSKNCLAQCKIIVQIFMQGPPIHLSLKSFAGEDGDG